MGNNFTVKDSWHIYSIAAYIIVLTSFINGISRYGYYIFVKGYDISDVPLEVNICNTKFRLDKDVHLLKRKKLFKMQHDDDTEEKRKLNKEVKKVKKDFQKAIDEMKGMKKEEAKRQDIAGNLNKILGMITDNRYKLLIRDVFKQFPNFDDGSINKNMFALAEGPTTAEENIKIEML